MTDSSRAAHFTIEAPASDTNLARSILKHNLEKIGEILNIEYDDSVRVIIASDNATFARAVGGEFPDWGAAAAMKAQKTIVVRSPEHFDVGKSLQELLGHELGHLMLDRAAAGKWLPRWFEEGFCQLVSGEWRFSQDILLTRAVWGSGLISLIALEDVNRFGGAKASLAYAESYLAVSMLVQEFGIEVIPDFLSIYRQSGNLYGSFYEATGYSYAEWVGLWQKKTSDRYRMVLFLFDASFLLPLMAVLFIILYIVKRYMARKKKKQWEIEEKYRGYDQDLPA